MVLPLLYIKAYNSYSILNDVYSSSNPYFSLPVLILYVSFSLRNLRKTI